MLGSIAAGAYSLELEKHPEIKPYRRRQQSLSPRSREMSPPYGRPESYLNKCRERPSPQRRREYIRPSGSQTEPTSPYRGVHKKLPEQTGESSSARLQKHKLTVRRNQDILSYRRRQRTSSSEGEDVKSCQGDGKATPPSRQQKCMSCQACRKAAQTLKRQNCMSCCGNENSPHSKRQ